MSLMTTSDLHKSTKHKIFHMDFVEFLEMICRAAEFHFIDSEKDHLPLHEKLKYILDELLETVNESRRDVNPFESEDEDEESDDENN